MFLLARLILAHLIGDFVLQPNQIYEGKRAGFKGVVAHSLIMLFSFILFTIPYREYPAAWVVILFAFCTHIIQDEIKLRRVKSARFSCVAFILDQVFHVIFLAPILLFPFSHTPPQGTGHLIAMYNNNALVIFMIGYILSLFMGAYLWESFGISYLKDYSFSEAFKIKYGIFERFIVTTALLKNAYFPFILLPCIFRMAIPKIRFSLDFFFTIVYAAAIGVALRRFLPIF